MLPVPDDMLLQFNVLLDKSHMPVALHEDSRKWLRYVLVFLNKIFATCRTVRIGRSDVRTTMIYTHCVPSKTLKEAKSPLDF